MRLKMELIGIIGMVGAVLTPVQSSAEVKVYPYPSSANYCPAGLQPVAINGIISCGTPNQSMTYQQVKVHPVRYRAHHTRHYHPHNQPRAVRYSCYPGDKGCR